MEADTRYIIDNNLKNKGWILDPSDPNCNVHLESPRDEQLKRKLKGKHPDYILYESGTKKPICIIEAKKGGVDLQKALEQGEEYARELNASLIFAMNGAYCETRFLHNKKPLVLNGEEVKELLKEKEMVAFLKENSNEVYTLPKNVVVSRHELIKVFKDLNNTLRAEGLRAGIERLSEFANILFLKLLSENGKQNYWDSIKNQKHSDILGFINGYVIDQIKEEYGGDVFTKLVIENPNTIREIIDRLDPLVLSTIDTDIKGDAFEYFLQKTTSTDNDLGEYFTPRHIVKTMVQLVNPIFKEKIYDPFCGTGGFLTEAFKYIKENTIIENVKDERLLKEHTIFGGELTTTARIAKMNMILQGDGHSGVQKINSLAHPRDREFDIVISNIPFSQKHPPTDLYYNGIAKNSGDAVCVLHCLRALKDGGRMALVVPEGFLVKNSLKDVRKFLLENAKLQAVISLPKGVFLPYTLVKTDILYFTDIRTGKLQKHFFYFDVKNDGYSLDNNRKKIVGKSDLQTVNSINFKKDEERDVLSVGFSLIDIERVKQENYNFVGSLYLKKKEQIKDGFVLLKDVCDVSTGKKDVNEGNPEGKYPFFTCARDHTYSDSYSFDTEAILIAGNGQVGDTKYYKGKFEAYQRTYILSDFSDKVLPEYLFFILKNKLQDYLLDKTLGTTMPYIRMGFLSDFPIPLLSIEKQKEIVEELTNKEKEIEVNEKKIEAASKEIKQKLNSLF